MPTETKPVEQAKSIPTPSVPTPAAPTPEKAKHVNPYEKALWKAVKAQVGMNREHGWGQADSMAAITEILTEEIGDKPDAMLLAAIDHVVNPSAFRQKLESVKRSDGQTILQKHEGKKRDRTLAAMDY